MSSAAIDAEKLPWVEMLRDAAPQSRDLMDTFKTFIRCSACALAEGQRETEYHDAIRGWSPAELEPFGDVLGCLVLDMEAHPYADVIGPAYELFEGRGNKQRTGSFYTPDSLSALTARLATPEWPEHGPLQIHDPAGGSGAMLLRLAEHLRDHIGAPPQSFVIQTWDINQLACDMAYINLTLYGVPAEVVWGDTLRYEVSNRWRNLWWYAKHGWHREPPATPQPPPPLLDLSAFGPLFGGATHD